MSRSQEVRSFSTWRRCAANVDASLNMASFRALDVARKCWSRLRPHFCFTWGVKARAGQQQRPKRGRGRADAHALPLTVSVTRRQGRCAMVPGCRRGPGLQRSPGGLGLCGAAFRLQLARSVCLIADAEVCISAWGAIRAATNASRACPAGSWPGQRWRGSAGRADQGTAKWGTPAPDCAQGRRGGWQALARAGRGPPPARTAFIAESKRRRLLAPRPAAPARAALPAWQDHGRSGR